MSKCVADDSKFGQKMLETMGWKKGKGLGAHEDGNTEHVQVHVKNNTKGRDYQVIFDMACSLEVFISLYPLKYSV